MEQKLRKINPIERMLFFIAEGKAGPNLSYEMLQLLFKKSIKESSAVSKNNVFPAKLSKLLYSPTFTLDGFFV